MSTDAATIERIEIQVKSQQSVCEHYCTTTIAVCLERHVLKRTRRSGIHITAGTEPKYTLVLLYSEYYNSTVGFPCGSIVDSARLSTKKIPTRSFVHVHHALSVSGGHTHGTVDMGTILAPRAMPTASMEV